VNPLTRPFLVGLEADGRADPALSAALAIAGRFGQRVIAVHAAPAAPLLWAAAEGAVALPVLEPSVIEALRKRLETRIAPRLAAAGGSAAFELRVVTAHPTVALVEEARTSGAGIVFLGPRRERSRIDFGSTARAVLARAPCGVWVQRDEPVEVRSILCGVDLSPTSLHALAVARDLAQALHARLDVLSAFPPPEVAWMGADEAALPPLWDVEALRRAAQKDLDAAAAAFDWRGVEHAVEFVEDEPAHALLERHSRADLVVIGTHGRSRLAAFLLGSVAYAVLRDAARPVLVVRDPARATD
jgi:nucleotide-binding universal stress UspA family protein